MRVKLRIGGWLFLMSIVVVSACSFKASSSGGSENVNTNSSSNAATSGTPTEAGAETKAAPPETLVADLYKQHDAKKSPFFQTKDRALIDKYFTKPLGDLIWKDANENKNEVGAISGDPLYNGQDLEIKNFAIGKGDIKGETAKVAATFLNFGEKQTVSYSLKLLNGAWKIDNIGYGGGDSLMKWLNETYSTKPNKETSVSGEFEGKYQIGETTCTVKPVKMAFEVRWAKGSGVEMFFAEGDNTFTSNPDKGEPNNFVFDDENYNTGQFLRGDGKTFAVKRIG